nr:MAG: capsid protein [Chemarfal virus 130]
MNLGGSSGMLPSAGDMAAVKIDRTIEPGTVRAAPPDVKDINDIRSVYRTIGTFAWSSATASQNIQLWNTYRALGPIVNTFVSQYGFFRGSPTVRISYTGASSIQGVARVFAVPARETDASGYQLNAAASDDYTTTPENQYARSASMPHIDLDASLSCVCELELPYLMQADFGLYTGANDYYLYFHPLSTLIKSDTTAANTLTVTVEVKYPDLEHINLVPQAGDQNAIASLLAYARRFASTYVSPAVAIVKKGVAIAEGLGFSRPPDEDLKQVVVRQQTNMSVMSGAGDGAIHLGVDPRQMANMADGDIPGVEINSYHDLLSKRNFFVSPFHFVYGTGYALGPDVLPYTLASTNEYPTPMNVITLMHEFWRGSFRVKIKFYSSPLVRTRVGINIIPPDVAGLGAFNHNGSVISSIVEIAGSMEYVMDVPYMWRDKCVQTTATAFNSSTRPRLYIFILEGPNGNGVSAQSPGVSMELISNPDFEVMHPTLDIINGYLVAQGRLAESVGEDVTSLRELAKRSSFAGYFTHGGGATATNAWVMPIPVMPPPLTTGTYNFGNGAPATVMAWSEPTWTFLSFINSFCLGSRGSTIIRVVIYDANRYLQDPCFAYYMANGVMTIGTPDRTIGGGVYVTTAAKMGGGMQVYGDGTITASIPDYCQERYKVNAIGPMPSLPGPVQVLVCGTYPYQAASTRYFAYYSAGDDTRFGFYMAPCWIPRP